MIILRLVLKSLWNRRGVAALTVFAITISVTLFLSVDKIRTGARDSFANTISGTDVIVGARTGPVQLLLYAVFRIGNATNNISWKSYLDIEKQRETEWVVPISLGDSHKGFRVLGTTQVYFEKFRYARKRSLSFQVGRPFSHVLDVVLGAEVAKELGYDVGDKIIISHGLDKAGFTKHDNLPFSIVGVLAATGTPVDQTVHISLQGIEAIHIGWGSGSRTRNRAIGPQDIETMKLQPKAVTAVLVGLKSKMQVFRFQRAINEYSGEPLMAILPGVALQELWTLMGTVEKALVIISMFVVIAGLLGMLTMILSGLNERRREMAILRSVGAMPVHIMALFVIEALLLSVVGACLGVVLTFVGLGLAQSFIEAQYGLYLTVSPPGMREGIVVLGVAAAGAIVGLWPAWRAYRLSVADGLVVRL